MNYTLARCSPATAKWFDPPGVEPDARGRLEFAAAAFCADCPLTRQCHQLAVDERLSGLFGGQLYADGQPVDLPRPGINGAGRPSEAAA